MRITDLGAAMSVGLIGGSIGSFWLWSWGADYPVHLVVAAVAAAATGPVRAAPRRLASVVDGSSGTVRSGAAPSSRSMYINAIRVPDAPS